MRNMELRYSSIVSIDGELTDAEFTHYCERNGLGDLVTKLVINPIEEKLKARKGKEIKIGNLTLSRTETSGTSTSWKPTLEGLAGFLEIRSDDARAKTIKGLKYLGGVGYCISVKKWGEQIEKQIETNTAKTKSVAIGWPPFTRKDSPVQRIEVPYNGLRKINEESVRIVIAARNFKASLKRELIDPFKDANKIWHARETGYDNKERIPSADQSPVQRARKIADGKYVFVQLVRVEDFDYENIVTTLQDEQEQLTEGVALTGYRTTLVDNTPFINIKMIRARMLALQEESREIKARYEIIP